MIKKIARTPPTGSVPERKENNKKRRKLQEEGVTIKKSQLRQIELRVAIIIIYF